MKNEMDVMSMDERQRQNWLSANRVTLFIVGLVWVGMIGFDILNNEIPYFLIAMVPTFALARLFSYLYYSKK